MYIKYVFYNFINNIKIKITKFDKLTFKYIIIYK